MSPVTCVSAFRQSRKVVGLASSLSELLQVGDALEALPRFRPKGVGNVGEMGFGAFGCVALRGDMKLELMGFLGDKRTLPLAQATLKGCVLAMVMGGESSKEDGAFREFLKLMRGCTSTVVVEVRSEQLVRIDRVLGAAVRAVIRSDAN